MPNVLDGALGSLRKRAGAVGGVAIHWIDQGHVDRSRCRRRTSDGAVKSSCAVSSSATGSTD